MKYPSLILVIVVLGSTLSCKNLPENENELPAQERFVNAQKDSLFAKEGFHILREIDAMMVADQGIRDYLHWGTSDTARIAVLEKDFTARGLLNDSILVRDLNLSGLTQQQHDSANEVLLQLQTKHTKRMLSIIDRYGYPGSKRFGEPEYGGTDPFILLYHPDVTFKDTITQLLYKEVRAGRQDSASVSLIEWSLNGREGLPEKLPAGVQIIYSPTIQSQPLHNNLRDTMHQGN